jgi:hypothetical protein
MPGGNRDVVVNAVRTTGAALPASGNRTSELACDDLGHLFTRAATATGVPADVDTSADDIPFGSFPGDAVFLYGFNGLLGWDRIGTATAPNFTLQPNIGVLQVAETAQWVATHEPAVNTQATASRAAGGATEQHVCKSIFATMNAVAAIAAPISLYLRDGASGVGAILWSARVILPIGQSAIISINGLSIVGSAATAMTLEWGAAPGAGNFQNVSLTGYSVQ